MKAVEENGAVSANETGDEEMPESSDTSLPVAEKVVPPPELLNRVRELEEKQQNHSALPSATPLDVEEEKRQARRRKCWIVSACILTLAVIVGAVLGVTLGGKNMTPAVSTTTAPPSPSPTTQDAVALQSLIESVSFDGGEALSVPTSPQSKAFTWLSTNANLEEYPDWRKTQRYVLAVFYYSTIGEEWTGSTDWLSDKDECKWASSAVDPVCNEAGAFLELVYDGNNLQGTIPVELGLLSDSLRK
jgi:hypothetical protein